MKINPFSQRAATLFAFCAILGFVGVPAARAQTKIGVVDIAKVYAGYYKTQDAEKKINAAREAAKKELDEGMESHQVLLDEIIEFNKVIDSMGDYADPGIRKDARSKRENKIRQMQSLENQMIQTRFLIDGRERDLRELSGRPLRNQIIEEIMRVVLEKVRAEKYDLVLDRSGMTANGFPSLLPSAQVSDFSDEVIAVLNKGH